MWSSSQEVTFIASIYNGQVLRGLIEVCPNIKSLEFALPFTTAANTLLQGKEQKTLIFRSLPSLTFGKHITKC